MNQSTITYFKYDQKGYIYSKKVNNLFQVSDLGMKSFSDPVPTHTKQDDELNVLQKELTDLSTIYDINPTYKEVYLAGSMIDITHNLSSQMALCNNALFILEFQEEISDLEQLFVIHEKIRVQNRSIRFLIKQDLKFQLSNNLIKKIIQSKIDFIYYSDFHDFSTFINTRNVIGKVYIDLKLNTIEELYKFEQMDVGT